MRWQIIKQRCEDGLDNDEENAESQEVLEDQLTTLLTRDYMELLGKAIMKHAEAGVSENKSHGAQHLTLVLFQSIGDLSIFTSNFDDQSQFLKGECAQMISPNKH